jgi:hypothetical protein
MKQNIAEVIMKKLFILCMLQFGFCSMYAAEIECRKTKGIQAAIKNKRKISGATILKYMVLREFCETKLKIKREDFLIVGSKFCDFIQRNQEARINIAPLRAQKIKPKLTIPEKILSGNKVNYCIDTTIGCVTITPIVETIVWIATGCNMSNAAFWGLCGGYFIPVAMPCAICGLYTCVELCCCDDE